VICLTPTQPFRVALGAESRVHYRVTQQTVNHNGCSLTATSRNQQQVRRKSRLTATTGAWTCDLWHASTPLWPLGQVPPPSTIIFCMTGVNGASVENSIEHQVQHFLCACICRSYLCFLGENTMNNCVIYLKSKWWAPPFTVNATRLSDRLFVTWTNKDARLQHTNKIF
jgi:hypothetical protein